MFPSRDIALGLAAGVLLALGFPSVALAFHGWLNHASATQIGVYAFHSLAIPVAIFALTGKTVAVRVTYVMLILFFLRDLTPLFSLGHIRTPPNVIGSFASAALYLLCIVSLSRATSRNR